MTQNVSISLFSLAINFFPYSEDDNPKLIELGTQCVNMAFSMVYDASIYVKDYHIMMYGLTILKYIYQKGKRRGLSELIDKVEECYDNLESNLKRPERKDLTDALDLLLLFKGDREEGSLTFPPLTEKLHQLIYLGQK